jgi:hypothetical protein
MEAVGRKQAGAPDLAPVPTLEMADLSSDEGSIVRTQMKEMQLISHQMLIEQAAKWLAETQRSEYRCGVVLKEYRCYLAEIPDVIGFNNQRSILIECKVNRQDFQVDQRKAHRKIASHLGNLRFYMALPNIVCPEEIPYGWGLLYPSDKRITIAKKPIFDSNPLVKQAEWMMLYSIARRCNLRGYLKDLQGGELK